MDTTEKLGILLVDLPEPSFIKYNFVYKQINGKFDIMSSDNFYRVKNIAYRCTKAEAEDKFPHFRWVAIEDLEKED